MKLFISAIVYAAIHFIICMTAIWTCRLRERGIFLFHVGSFLILGVMLIGFLLLNFSEGFFTAAVASLAFHAIYSLSFLELWALSDGGFSLRILADASGPARLTLRDIVARHRKVSDEKKIRRIASLISLGLVSKDGMAYRLTSRGRFVSTCFAGIAALSGFRQGG